MLANGHEYDALEGNAIASTSAIPLDDADDSREILILYASQTGSAQDVAEYIAREAWRRHFDARVLSIADFDKVRPYVRFIRSLVRHKGLMVWCSRQSC